MTPVGLILPSPDVPRTVFYERFLDAVRAQPGFTAGSAAVLFPAEDTSQETNWPRYGDRDSAWARAPDPATANGVLRRYLERLVAEVRARPAQRLVVVNMHPAARLPLMLRTHPNVIVADGSLSEAERAQNPRTISMPALPMVGPPPAAPPPRTVLASFQGGASHPVREALARLHDGGEIVVNLVRLNRHAGRIDVTVGRTDAEYEALLDRSVFGFVPRGDALFSYRLLEVLARGAIPVVLSDGWVLPFDRTLDWTRFALHVPEAEVAALPGRLRAMSGEAIARLQAEGRRAYATAFADLDRIVGVVLAEAGRLG